MENYKRIGIWIGQYQYVPGLEISFFEPGIVTCVVNIKWVNHLSFVYAYDVPLPSLWPYPFPFFLVDVLCMLCMHVCIESLIIEFSKTFMTHVPSLLVGRRLRTL
jgi:hypothetical protein